MILDDGVDVATTFTIVRETDNPHDCQMKQGVSAHLGYNSILQCDMCGRYWVKKYVYAGTYKTWVPVRWYHFWTRRYIQETE